MLTTRHRGSRARRQEVIEAARKIVATRGMEGVTTKNLADAVGLTEGALYRHFRSKEEILEGLVDEVGEVLGEILQKAEESAQSPLGKLEVLLKEHLSSAERRHGVTFLVIAGVLGNSDLHLRRRMQHIISGYLTKVEEILEDGVRSGQISPERDKGAAAIAFFGLIQGAVTLWRFASPDLPLAGRYLSLWQIYRTGILRNA